MKYMLQGLVFYLMLMIGVAGVSAAEYHKTKVAVLDFQQQGAFASQDVGKIVAEWFTTSLVETGRFEVIERRLMQQILQEQKMGSSGLLDPASASRIGKILGVKTVVTGTVQSYERTYELNVRLINVETGAIITADRVRAGSTTSLNDLVSKVSARIIQHFPLDGYVVKRDENGVMIDLGRQAGVHPGMLFDVFVEGAPVRHPKTGEVLSVERIPKGQVQIVEARDKTALAVVVQEACPDCIQAGQLVSSRQMEELALRPEESARQREEDRKREEAERKLQEKRDKEAREYQEKREKEAQEREKERLKALEEDRKRQAERVSQAAISGLAPLGAFPVQREELRSLAVTPNGALAATGDGAGQIVIWDLSKTAQLGSLPGHLKGAVVALEFSADGRYLVSAGKDKRVTLWDVARRQQLATIEVKDTPSAVAVAASGRLVAIGSTGRESWLWDSRSNRLRAIKNPDDVLAVALSADGRLLATAGQDKAVTLWDVATGRSLKALSGHNKDVRAVSFAGNRQLVSAGDDKLVLVWDIKNGSQQQVLRGHEDGVVHLALAKGGQRLVSAEKRRSGGVVILWDLAKGQELKRYRVEKRVDLLEVTPDGQLLVIGSGRELTSYRLE